MKHQLQGHKARLHFVGEHNGSHEVAFHNHAVPELILVTTGTCQTDTSDEQFACEPGDLIWIPAGVSHNQIDHGHVRTLYVGVTGSNVHIARPRLVHMSSANLIEHCMWSLLQLHTRRWQGLSQSVDHLLHVLLAEVTQQFRPVKQTGSQRRLDDLMDWIEVQIDQPLCVEKLAEQGQLSASRLFQLFDQHLHQSPMQYVQTRRMIRARAYLKNPYLSVKQVASQCGYPDVNLFVRTFKRNHNLPPGKWRLKHML